MILFIFSDAWEVKKTIIITEIQQVYGEETFCLFCNSSIHIVHGENEIFSFLSYGGVWIVNSSVEKQVHRNGFECEEHRKEKL